MRLAQHFTKVAGNNGLVPQINRVEHLAGEGDRGCLPHEGRLHTAARGFLQRRDYLEHREARSTRGIVTQRCAHRRQQGNAFNPLPRAALIDRVLLERMGEASASDHEPD